MSDKENDVQKAVEELIEDPDSPYKGNSRPPQTIDAEPAQPGKEVRGASVKR